MNTRKLAALLAILGIFAAGSGEAAAYHPIPGFHLAAQSGGGARIYYTGSPRWLGQDCGSCHTETDGRVRFALSATPEDIFTTGRYEPGTTYRITIDISGAEGKGLRTWMLETLDDSDIDVGSYRDVAGGCTSPQGTPRGCLQPSCTFMCRNRPEFRDTCAPDGQPICDELIQIPGCGHCGGRDGCGGCVTVDGIVGGVTVPPPWRLDFIAPPAGTGAINLYFGGVAGTSDHSSLNDDYEMQFHRLCEGASECGDDPSTSAEPGGDYVPQPRTTGCSAATPSAIGERGGWLVLVLLALFAVRRRQNSNDRAREPWG